MALNSNRRNDGSSGRGAGGRRPSGRGGDGARSVIQGLLLLGRGRPEGLAEFDVSVQGFLTSLAPWVAFLLVGALLVGVHDRPVAGLTDVAVALCWLLMPTVLAERLAWWWDREPGWLPFVTATMWCKWLVPAVYAAGLAVTSVALAAGLPERASGILVVGLMSAYLLWLNFFLARTALSLSRLRSAVLVGATLCGYVALLGIEHLVGGTISKLLGI